MRYRIVAQGAVFRSNSLPLMRRLSALLRSIGQASDIEAGFEL